MNFIKTTRSLIHNTEKNEEFFILFKKRFLTPKNQLKR